MLKAVTRCLWSNPVAGRRMLSHHISPNLAGKVAIVTASTDGIGLAAAEALGQRGAHVVILGVNVKASFLLTKLVVPHMEKRGGGSVVIVSSVAGYQPMPGLGPYSVSKTALLGLTRALAPDLAQSNIRINCVAPGIIKTRFSSALWENEGVLEEFLKQTSIKRLGQPEDIGGVIAFLCSDEASYITGETITVTGGMNCRL
ncbi:dehydrogenase/reductase SDR family member 4 isoform X2 [Chanodichthys erythropterus]|uniref:dehydrogenase/reductase SDR family member 4 isoform X2 n=1 Tax=Chanodichthys erythropterus TaxID=933992 RepID=UPI00351E3626